MNTRRYMEANGTKNEKIALKAYLRPSLTIFCWIIFWTYAGKTEKNTSQQQFSVFSTVYSDT